MMRITNVRWGLMGEPYGQRCLYFDLNGRPASAFWEQKQGVTARGYVSVDFEDGAPSTLPATQILDGEREILASVYLVHSPWLVQKLQELCDAKDFEDGRLIGDAPEEA
jgi:hypothetical protein